MSKENHTILLVEDNIAHVELISRAFEDYGSDYKLNIQHSIRDAKNAINSNIPDLIISDLKLPDGTGTELIPAAENYYKMYPVILMTSYGDENVAVEAIKLGALDYVVKSPEVFDLMPKHTERVLREWENIVARENAQKALFEKESEQREILNSIMDAVITIDENSTILSFNKFAEKLFSYTKEDIVGKNLSCLVPEKYREKHAQGLKHYIEKGEANIMAIEGGVELEAMRKDQSCFPIRLSIGELPESDKGVKRFIGICQDLTLLKLQEQQLQRSQKMEALGKLTGGVAHDYNNMLGVILGYAELLELKFSDDAEAIKYVNEISHAGERGVKLTKKLLSFSRKKMSDAFPLNLNEVLQEQQHMLEKTLTARINLALNYTDDSWMVNLDRSELEDTIVNLSINAMHAMDENGELDISIDNVHLNPTQASVLQLQPGEFVSLSFKDNGKGMSREVQSKIFEPFFTTKGEFGTGLGLSQVYGFVERSNGAIQVDSLVDVGTCITLYFPRDDNEEQTEHSIIDDIQLETSNTLAGDEAILVTDDEAGLRKISAEILTSRGYQVFTAENADDALKILENETIDLLFTDVIMPGMDGYQLAKIVKEKYPSVKIQLASGYNDDRHLMSKDAALHESLLAKPFDSKQLLSCIRKLLDSK